MKRKTQISKARLSMVFLWLLSSGVALKSEIRSKPLFGYRGGAIPGGESSASGKNTTVEKYVAAMKEKDRNVDDEGYTDDGGADADSSEEPSSSATTESSPPAVVAVKSHAQKKSNAVGDPDGNDDDSDSDTSDYSEEWEELEGFDGFEDGEKKADHQVQIEVELVEDENGIEQQTSTKSGGGGVGVRLGRMANRRRNRKDSWRSTTATPSQEQAMLLEAWMPHIYFPPTSAAKSYLSENARLLDASSKNRLDRRTLYAGLLLEWGTSTGSKITSRTRKYVSTSAAQTLQAALSMATQPQWRQSAPRTSGIRLYEDEEVGKSCTLGMQETIAMALVRSPVFKLF
eukprot:scaffold22568_cov125-Cylindrotheca_fusiformis.AAC.8